MKHNVWLSSLVVAFAACSGGAGSAPIPATASRAGAPAAGQAQPMDTARARILLGWEPRFTLEAALADYLAEAREVGGDARRKLRA